MTIVIVSVVFGITYKMYKAHLAFKTKTLAHNDNSDEHTTKLIAQVAKLTERVQVLEKIVTDEGYQIQKDINNL